MLFRSAGANLALLWPQFPKTRHVFALRVVGVAGTIAGFRQTPPPPTKTCGRIRWRSTGGLDPRCLPCSRPPRHRVSPFSAPRTLKETVGFRPRVVGMKRSAQPTPDDAVQPITKFSVSFGRLPGFRLAGNAEEDPLAYGVGGPSTISTTGQRPRPSFTNRTRPAPSSARRPRSI